MRAHAFLLEIEIDKSLRGALVLLNEECLNTGYIFDVLSPAVMAGFRKLHVTRNRFISIILC